MPDPSNLYAPSARQFTCGICSRGYLAMTLTAGIRPLIGTSA